MNKISKKIVALATMAAFVLTLVPAAAFGATANGVTIEKETDTSVNVSFTQTYENVVVHVQKPGVATEETLDMKKADGEGDSLGTTGSSVGTVTDGYDYRIELPAAATYNVWVTSGDKQLVSEQVYSNGTASEGASYLTIESAASATVDPGASKQVTFNIMDSKQNPAVGGLSNVIVWAENEDGYLTDAVTFSDGTGNDAATGATGTVNDKFFVMDGAVDTGETITATFNYPGTYTIYAATFSGYAADLANATTVETALTGLDPFHAGVKVTINPYTYVTKTIDITSVNDDTNVVDGTKANTYTYTITDGVTPNGIKVYEVEGVALQANGTPAQYETLNISCVKSDLKVIDTKVGTNAKGEFSFRFTIAEPGSYTVKIAEANGDATATLTVVDETAAPLDIKTTEQGGTLLAGNDSNYAANRYQYLTDAVQFSIIDVYDEEAEGANVIANEGAADKDSTDPEHSDLLAVTAKGDKSTLDEDDLELAWDAAHGVYTLEYVGTTPSTDLVPGKYTVEVSLNNGKKAVASFNLAKFGTVQDVILDMTADHYAFAGQTSQDNAITAIDDQVALGQRVTIDPKYVDENGIKINADLADIQLGVNGEAVADRDLNNGIFYTEPNVAANNSLIGTVITVKAFDEVNSKYVEKELTVVKAYLAETLSFDPTSGAVNADNDVTVSVVDEDGNISKVNGTLSAYVADKSNADANVELDVDQNVRNGKGELTLYSDAEGTVDVVAVVTADNGEMYGATLTYTFGAEDPEAENTVVMTIGSTDYVVNNDIIKGDAAPYVDAQWRTMVPFRVLGETFGAEVNWDQDTQTVTYTYGDTELTMTIGEETYTVNGTEKTMDTAPVLSGDRTFVPVRFVGEALGYTVTALQDTETGLTASVVFQK